MIPPLATNTAPSAAIVPALGVLAASELLFLWRQWRKDLVEDIDGRSCGCCALVELAPLLSLVRKRADDGRWSASRRAREQEQSDEQACSLILGAIENTLLHDIAVAMPVEMAA